LKKISNHNSFVHLEDEGLPYRNYLMAVESIKTQPLQHKHWKNVALKMQCLLARLGGTQL